MDNKKKVVIFVSAIVLFLLVLFALIYFGNSARDFLGDWRCDLGKHSMDWGWSRYETWVLKQGSHQPKPVIKLGKKDACLLLAVDWCTQGYPCEHCGIYETDPNEFVLVKSDTRSPYSDAFKVRKKGRDLQWAIYQFIRNGTCSYLGKDGCYITCSPK